MEFAGVHIATVVDNKDPNQMGRIKISFPWDAENTATSWAPTVQPMAGNKYGVYMLPEVGDQVMVAFMNDNSDHPVVIGSLYNAQSQQADCYDDNNYIKNIKTKAGNEIRFLDKPGEEQLLITNPGTKNQITLNMKDDGSITIQSQGNIEMKGKAITIEAQEDFTLKAKNIILNADQKITATAKMSDVQVKGVNVKLNADSGFNVAAAQVDIEAQATATLKGNAQVTVQASGQTAIKGAIVMIN